MLALLAGLAVIAAALLLAARHGDRAAPSLVAAGVAIAVADSGRLHLSFSDTTAANNATSFRASLVKGGFDLFTDRPLAGLRLGFVLVRVPAPQRHSRAATRTTPPTRTRSRSPSPPSRALIGLVAYVLLLVAAFWRLAAGGVRGSPARVAILAAFVALVVHTWAYADFLEDPITWTLLAVGGAVALAGARRQDQADAGPARRAAPALPDARRARRCSARPPPPAPRRARGRSAAAAWAR